MTEFNKNRYEGAEVVGTILMWVGIVAAVALFYMMFIRVTPAERLWNAQLEEMRNTPVTISPAEARWACDEGYAEMCVYDEPDWEARYGPFDYDY